MLWTILVDIADLVAAGISGSRGWRLDSHLVGDSCDRIDIQPGHWTARGLRRPSRRLSLTLRPGRWESRGKAGSRLPSGVAV